MIETRARKRASGRAVNASGVGSARRLQSVSYVGGFLDSADLLAGELQLGGDVLLRGLSFARLADLATEFKPQRGSALFDLLEGGAHTSDAGHGVGHLLIIAPLVRPP